MRWRVRLAVLPCLIIAGCGGQTGSPEGTGGGEHTSAVGIATISYGGKIVPAASFSQSGVTATSMAGALFSKVTLNPAQKPENSAIVFSMNGQIWTLQNGIQKQITNTNQNFNTPAVSKNGLVVFSGIDFASLNWQLYTCNLDGSNLHRITSSAISHSSPAFSPSGAKIVCSNGGDSLYVLNSDGSNEQKLTITGASAGKSPYPTWTADGTQILFSNYDSVSTRRLLYSVPSGGGAATQFPDQGINCTQPSC
ncbi:MAG TPA: hypothetical protein VG944_10340, partial [Fimbriimonas sp.]|nr:hypothetical protein [Fimbriimonas sp.]